MTTWTMCRLRRRGDDGAVLVVALAFLLLFALFVPAILGTTSTNLSVSSSLELQRNEIHAAEAGLRTRVETLRNSRSSAVYGSTCGPTAMGTFNGTLVRVQCSPQPSSGDTGITRPEYALLALPSVDSNTEGITDRPTVGGGGGTADVYVGGNIASNGMIKENGSGSSGHFYVSGTAKGHSCDGDIDDPVTNTNVCEDVTTVFTDPGVGRAVYDQSGGFPAATNPVATCLSNAAQFLPGYYSAMPTSPCGSRPWWFSPGLYYFDFTTGSHVLDLDSKTVVAGTPNTTNFDPAGASGVPVMPGACKVDGDLPPYAGVEWIFGADTVLSVGDGVIELCPSVSFTSQEISVRGYGAQSLTSTDRTTVTRRPTSHVSNPASGYTVGPVDTGANAYAIDSVLATSTTSAGKQPKSTTLTVRGFADLPSGASVEKLQLRLKHAETLYTQAPTLSAVINYGPGTTSTTWATGCGADQLCQSATLREDGIDITEGYVTGGAPLSELSIAFTVTVARNMSATETLDGVELDVTYAPPGGFRRQAGCAVLPVTSDYCNTIDNDEGAKLYIQGTVYAPLGRVAVVTADGDPVQLNRGVIARDIVGAIHPGNGAANPFGIGRPQRLALLTAEVLKDGAWVPRTESLVRFDDNIATVTTRARVNYLSWRVLR